MSFKGTYSLGRAQSAPLKGKIYKMEETEEDTDEDNETVKVVDNNIYFYCPVTMNTILELTLSIKKLTTHLIMMQVQFGSCFEPIINLYINSEGGDVVAILGIVDIILNNKVPIHTIITGHACSAASILSIIGAKRYIAPNSYMLIHNLSSTFWGKAHEFEDEMKNINKLMANLKKIYSTHGKIPKTKLEALLKKDLYLDAKTSLKLGFVDEIGLPE